MSPLTTHILDTSRGLPAEGVAVRLERRQTGGAWKLLAEGRTDKDGRAPGLLPAGADLPSAVYRLSFETGAYFSGHKIRAFYPVVEVTFEVAGTGHYHVPLLISPFGYSTYRGS